MNLPCLFVVIFIALRVNTAIFNAKPFAEYQRLFEGHRVAIEAMVVLCFSCTCLDTGCKRCHCLICGRLPFERFKMRI